MTRQGVENIINDIDRDGSYPWKHKLQYLLAHDQAQREEIARLREALEGVMTGGNHLALQITNSFGEHPPVEASCEEAMKFYGVGVQGWDGQAWKFDVWVCWKKIMQAQAALAKEATHDKAE